MSYLIPEQQNTESDIINPETDQLILFSSALNAAICAHQNGMLRILLLWFRKRFHGNGNEQKKILLPPAQSPIFSFQEYLKSEQVSY